MAPPQNPARVVSSSPSPSRGISLTTGGAAFGALTGCLGAGMIWATRAETGLEAAGGVLMALLIGAAAGWFGTECLVALTSGIEEISE